MRYTCKRNSGGDNAHCFISNVIYKISEELMICGELYTITRID